MVEATIKTVFLLMVFSTSSDLALPSLLEIAGNFESTVLEISEHPLIMHVLKF